MKHTYLLFFLLLVMCYLSAEDINNPEIQHDMKCKDNIELVKIQRDI